MALPVEKVEVGFDQSFSGAGNFLTLDNAVKGQLDDASYPLAGLQFVDVTSRVRNFGIARGRSSLFSQFPAGQASIEFNNHDRAFDPLYASSPFAGNIIPRREIRITTGTAVQFLGWIDDWNLTYTPDGDSIVEAICYDAIGILAGQTLALGTPTEELTGARIDAILDQVNWSPESRNIDTGQATLSTAAIEEGTNAMNYLQTVGESEPGLVFIGRQGSLQFRDRLTTPTSDSLIEFGGTAIPFNGLQVVYGSENLYNEIRISREGGGTATAQDTQSISDYGLRNYSDDGLLLSSDGQLVDLALVLAQRYSQPEYRFEALEVAVHKISPAQQADVLEAEIGGICKVTFTPNGIGDPIERFVQIIRIAHTVNTETHFVEFGFQALDYAALVLDDAEFGKLDTYSLSW
jgi:hypothetical protein